MRKKGSTKPVQNHEAESYFLKAKEFYSSMKLEEEFEKWNTVGLCGVHCAISASDALLAIQAKIRSKSQNHYDVVSLVRQHIVHPETKIQTNRLERIIKLKNVVEYEGEMFTQKQAKSIVLDVERYFAWVNEICN